MRKYEILEKTIKKMVLDDLSKYELSDNFSGVEVDIHPYSTYGNTASITILMKEPFTLEESDFFDKPLYEIKRHISVVFSDFLRAGVASSISTEENYYKTSKPDYDKRKKLMEYKSKNVIVTEKQFNMIVNENDTINLRRRLSSELYNEIVSHQKIRIDESSLNRLYNHIKSKDCAVITAFRKQLINCKGNMDSDEKLNIKTNKGRNISLKSALLSLGYGVTNVKGTYIENYLQDNSVEVKEDS